MSFYLLNVMLCLLSIAILLGSFVETSFIHPCLTLYYPWHVNNKWVVLLKCIKTCLRKMIYIELISTKLYTSLHKPLINYKFLIYTFIYSIITRYSSVWIPIKFFQSLYGWLCKVAFMRNEGGFSFLNLNTLLGF